MNRILILTGAGVSKESGLDTFRDADGTWSKFPLEEVATPEAFARNPQRVHEFYNARRRTLRNSNITPNAAHRALVNLERTWPGEVLVVTQNIDDLHDRAGSRHLIHMHGELLKARCQRCKNVGEWPDNLSEESVCPKCREASCMRPHVVWFGEIPLEMDVIQEAVAACDLFVAIGTSGVVYPAAGFVQEARRAGAHTVELNLGPSEGHSLFAERIYGPATEIVPAFVDDLLRQAPKPRVAR